METVTIYDLEIDKDRFERLKKNIEIIDPSRNTSKKHYAKQALKLSDYLLNEEIDQADNDLAKVSRKLNNLKEALK